MYVSGGGKSLLLSEKDEDIARNEEKICCESAKGFIIISKRGV